MARLQNITSLYQVAQAAFDDNFINVMDEKYGVIADGKSHPLSERYATLEEAYAAYPKYSGYINSLDDQIDSVGIMEAYMDALDIADEFRLRDNYSDYEVDSSWAHEMQIKPVLFVPRRYYRVTLDQVWFSGPVDIWADGAGFIGDSVSDSGQNFYVYPSGGQPAKAGAVITIGSMSYHDDIPTFVTDRRQSRQGVYRLPYVFSDHGYSHDEEGWLEEFAKGIGIRIAGMYGSHINIPAVYGQFFVGVLFQPLNEGFSFNEITLGEIGGSLINFKFSPVGSYDSGLKSWITSNRLIGGNNYGPGHSYYGEPGNSGICFDFDNDGDKYHNAPLPDGWDYYWKVGHTEIVDFHIENRYQQKLMRLKNVTGLTMRRARCEAWNYPVYSGYDATSIGYGTTAVERPPNITYDQDDYSVSHVIFEDCYSLVPYIEPQSEESSTYVKNTVRIVSRPGRIGNDGGQPFRWNGIEDYNYIPGAGPIITSTDGLRVFRLQMKESGGSYSLTPQELGLPIVSIRASGAGDESWQVLRDGVPYDIINVPVSGYVEIKPHLPITEESYSLQALLYRTGVDTGTLDRENDESSWTYSSGIDNFYMQVWDPGIYRIRLINRKYCIPSSGLDFYDGSWKSYEYPPFSNLREWNNLIRVDAE